MNQTHLFNLKFTIFDENEEVSEAQKKLRFSLMEYYMGDIISKAFINEYNYKRLYRIEASISSFDEKKQLTLKRDGLEGFKKYQHSLHFCQLNEGNNFTIEELKFIAYKIKIGLEEFLGYEIDDPIIYLEVNDFMET
jgi:hypothetical protein